jgi:hypothetical protein
MSENTEPKVVKSIPLSSNFIKRQEAMKAELQRIQQQFEQELSVMAQCFAEGAGMTESQYFQINGDVLEICEKQG